MNDDGFFVTLLIMNALTKGRYAYANITITPEFLGDTKVRL